MQKNPVRFAIATLLCGAVALGAGPALALDISHITDAELMALEDAGEVAIDFVAEGRWGDNGTAQTFELSLGERTDVPNAAQAQFAWGGSPAELDLRIELSGDTVSYTVGGVTLSEIFENTQVTDIFVRTRARDVQYLTDTRSRVDSLVLDGASIAGHSESLGTGAADILHIALDVGLDGGFVLTGRSIFEWLGKPEGALQSNIAYQIKFGTSAAPIPEPGAALLFALGAVLLGTRARHTRPR